jgi:hypothetical protein
MRGFSLCAREWAGVVSGGAGGSTTFIKSKPIKQRKCLILAFYRKRLFGKMQGNGV